MALKDSMSQKLQAWEEWIHFENLSNGDCYWQKVEIAISGVILIARTRSRSNIVGAGCVPQLPPLRICEYHIPEIHSFGNWTFYKGFLLDEDTLWQPTRMRRSFGDKTMKKNGLVIASRKTEKSVLATALNNNADDDVFVTLSRWLIHLQQTVRTGLEQKVGKQTKAAVSADWFLSATHHITINIVECK